jgi:methyltransferase (TIGR00027 family)
MLSLKSNVPSRKQRPIKSAEAVAALRAVSAWESQSPDYLARDFVGGWYSLMLALPPILSKRLTERVSPGSYCYFMARTRFMDEQLERMVRTACSEQVVILGAGYDSRAHRFRTSLPKVRFFEVDLPGTQAAKLRRLAEGSHSLNPNVVYVPLDLGDGMLGRELERAGFRFQDPTVVLWEGVSYYLQPSAAEGVFRFVSEELAAGSCILFDYALRGFVEGDESLYGGPEMQRWLRKNKEPFLFGLDPGELTGYLGRLGLQVVEDLGTDEIRARFLLRPDGTSIGMPFGHLRLASARKVPSQPRSIA